MPALLSWSPAAALFSHCLTVHYKTRGNNPMFASWSVLYIPYCSGDDWLGTMTRACDAWSVSLQK